MLTGRAPSLAPAAANQPPPAFYNAAALDDAVGRFATFVGGPVARTDHGPVRA